MKIYRSPIRMKPEEGVGDEHEGYEYFTDKSKANKHFDNNGGDKNSGDSVEAFDIKLNKKSILSFLNSYCSYPDNG